MPCPYNYSCPFCVVHKLSNDKQYNFCCIDWREGRSAPLRMALMAAGNSANATVRRDWLGHGCRCAKCAPLQREQGSYSRRCCNKVSQSLCEVWVKRE